MRGFSDKNVYWNFIDSGQVNEKRNFRVVLIWNFRIKWVIDVVTVFEQSDWANPQTHLVDKYAKMPTQKVSAIRVE